MRVMNDKVRHLRSCRDFNTVSGFAGRKRGNRPNPGVIERGTSEKAGS